jgi:hypothetical protein
MVFQGDDEGVMGRMALAKTRYSVDCFLEVDGLAKRLVVQSMRDYRFMAIVVHICLHTLDPAFQVLYVSLYLGVTGKLVTAQIGIMRGIAKVIRQRKSLIHCLWLADIIRLLAQEKLAKVVEGDHGSSLVQYLRYGLFVLLLLEY